MNKCIRCQATILCTELFPYCSNECKDANIIGDKTSTTYPEPKEEDKRPLGATPMKVINAYRFTKKELQEFIKYMEEENTDEMNIPVLEERKVC